MKRNILLIEPNYKNKYPPIGLMKLAAYHRRLGDHVVFYKGNLKNFVLDDICEEVLKKFKEIEKGVTWEYRKSSIIQYLMTGKSKILENILEDTLFNRPILVEWLKYFRNYYRRGKYRENPKWDRVCITTLFTFHWKITIETIELAKSMVKDLNELWVGGVLATVLHDEVKKETNIKTYKGLLDKPGILDDNEYIIDQLPLDYSILDEIDYKYPESNAYYGYMTRGCVRKCDFCAVWKLEPHYKNYIPMKDNIKEIKREYGEQRNLLLLDNNVLASKCFVDIIKEIKKSGFTKGAKFVEPNYLQISMKNLKKVKNDRAYTKRTYQLLDGLLQKAKGDDRQKLYNILERHHLLSIDTVTKENLIKAYPLVLGFYEKYRSKSSRFRYVDFNQGVDSRFISEKKMKMLSEIPIKPLRIAFDSMEFKEKYINSVKWAAKYGIRNLSNYLLYNFEDEPSELYTRLKINVKLANDLNILIHSFPMKYLPIDGDKYYKNRDYVGKYWNKKFLRAVQVILNSTKGKISRSAAFFQKAFGRNEEEYFELLYMPETYLIFRYFFEHLGYVEQWKRDFSEENLTNREKETAKRIIQKNNFANIENLTTNPKILKLLKHYSNSIKYSFKNPGSELYRLKKEFENSGKREKAVAKYKNLVKN
jgi:hypothetical protein